MKLKLPTGLPKAQGPRGRESDDLDARYCEMLLTIQMQVIGDVSTLGPDEARATGSTAVCLNHRHKEHAETNVNREHSRASPQADRYLIHSLASSISDLSSHIKLPVPPIVPSDSMATRSVPNLSQQAAEVASAGAQAKAKEMGIGK